MLRLRLPWRAGQANGGNDDLHLRPIAGELHGDLWSHAHDEPIELTAFNLAGAYGWLNAQLLTSDRMSTNPDVLALAAVALQSWDGHWSETEDGMTICGLLKQAIGPSDEISSERAWAGAIALRVLQQRQEDVQYIQSLAGRLATLAATTTLNAASAAQVAVSLRLTGLETHSAASTSELVGNALEGEDPYRIAQAVWAAAECGDADEADVERWRDFVGDWLDGRRLNRGNLATACACVQALAVSTDGGEVLEVRVQAERILKEGRHADGSWYGSTWETAWALLATHSAHQIRWMTLSAAESAELVAHVSERLAEAEHQLTARAQVIRTQIVPEIGVLALALGALVATAIAVLIAQGFSVTMAILGAGVTLGIIFILGQLRALYRRL